MDSDETSYPLVYLVADHESKLICWYQFWHTTSTLCPSVNWLKMCEFELKMQFDFSF